MQRFPSPSIPTPPNGPLVLLFERNDAIAVPLLGQLRVAGYDVRAARIPVEVFDLMQREPVELVLIDLGNAAANRREFWVGLDSQRRNRTIHIITFRYMTAGETGHLEEGLRIARADVEVLNTNGFEPIIEAVRARLPGVVPLSTWNPGQPANLGLPPAAAQQSPQALSGLVGGPQWTPLGPASTQDVFMDSGPDARSPFEKPYVGNPFAKGGRGAVPQNPFADFGKPEIVDPSGTPAPGNDIQWDIPATPQLPPVRPANPNGAKIEDYAAGFSATPPPAKEGSIPRYRPRSAAQPEIEDAWEPPEPPARRGIAYRGFTEEEPLSPDDPRIEGNTSPVPILQFQQASQQHGVRDDRALSTILTDTAVIAPQRLDALRSIQQTLTGIGMEFSLSDLAMLFRFLTPDQLLAALLVSRGLVDAEQIASLGRIKQELSVTGKDYDLETLLVMFNVLPAAQVRQLRDELA